MAYTAAQRKSYFARKAKEGKKHEKIPFTPIANPSVYQKAIFDCIANEHCNIVIQACAGGAKSTTLLNSLQVVPGYLKTIFIAFGKDIADELRAKNPNPAVDVSTTHSFGSKIVYQNGGKDMDKNKVPKLLELFFGAPVDDSGKEDEDKVELYDQMEKTVSLCKANLTYDANGISEVIDGYDIEFMKAPVKGKEHAEGDIETKRSEFIANVLKVINSTINDFTSFDFNDMIFLPAIKGWNIPKYDMILADEIQDFSRCQLKLLRLMMKSDSRLVGCGDRRQNLFSWRGSYEKGMDDMVSELSAKELPLSTTYRCGKKIVAYTHRMVAELDSFQAGENNIDGEVNEDVSFDTLKEKIAPGDVILSRVNAPLMSLAINLLRNEKPCQILGRDLGNHFKFFVKNSKAKTIAELFDYLDNWESAQFRMFNERKNKPKNMEGMMENVADKAACIRAVAMDCLDMKDFNRKVDKLFSPDDKANPRMITLSSVHRAKGAEWDNVWVLQSTLKIGKSLEEDNICYVAFSRAKKSLNLVKGTLRG